jgi:Rps23 Pro-64 3,4-dihydroxylase Tpa1-like proline 4-hydroxylase
MSEQVFSTQLDRREAQALGASLHADYASGAPYPHIKLDGFLDPDILDSVLKDLAASELTPGGGHYRAQENKKVSFNPDNLPPTTRQLFQYFNSQPFVAFIEGLTGIKGLIPDATYLGGGIHEVRNGGHLSIHADFNFHPALKLERRVNVLIYLNRDWQPEYGGQFEFWDHDMKERQASFDPLFNRCVVFNTTSDSYHGNPNPVQHPDGIARRSIALYYYTATWDPTRRNHTTQFKTRPGTADKIDWSIKTKELVRDLTPPILLRTLTAAKTKVKA